MQKVTEAVYADQSSVRRPQTPEPPFLYDSLELVAQWVREHV
jgi:hypothetical protein